MALFVAVFENRKKIQSQGPVYLKNPPVVGRQRGHPGRAQPCDVMGKAGLGEDLQPRKCPFT